MALSLVHNDWGVTVPPMDTLMLDFLVKSVPKTDTENDPVNAEFVVD
jgi:hypothetical protein